MSHVGLLLLMSHVGLPLLHPCPLAQLAELVVFVGLKDVRQWPLLEGRQLLVIVPHIKRGTKGATPQRCWPSLRRHPWWPFLSSKITDALWSQSYAGQNSDPHVPSHVSTLSPQKDGNCTSFEQASRWEKVRQASRLAFYGTWLSA